MAFLHQVRSERRVGLTRARARRALAALALLGSVACDAPPDLQPDAELQRAYGLTPRDRVHVVALEHVPPVERVSPVETSLRIGDWVVFQAADGFGRRVLFELDSLSAEALDWVTAHEIEAGPPLLTVGVRWVISFDGAPEGRYPFRVEGSAQPARGALNVDARSRFPFYTP